MTFLYDFLSLQNDVILASKINKQKYFFKLIFVAVLKGTEENCRIRSRIRIRVRYSEVRIRGSGSVPKCHGTATLIKIKHHSLACGVSTRTSATCWKKLRRSGNNSPNVTRHRIGRAAGPLPPTTGSPWRVLAAGTIDHSGTGYTVSFSHSLVK